MTGALYLCGGNDWDWCEKHQRKLHGYPCHACQLEWEEANPRTVAAIGRFASGKGTSTDVKRASKLDREARRR